KIDLQLVVVSRSQRRSCVFKRTGASRGRSRKIVYRRYSRNTSPRAHHAGRPLRGAESPYVRAGFARAHKLVIQPRGYLISVVAYRVMSKEGPATRCSRHIGAGAIPHDDLSEQEIALLSFCR